MQPQWNLIRKSILDTCKMRSKTYLMVSGGVDSMFLLDFVANIGVGRGCTAEIDFEVIHFVHGIRSPDESMKDLHIIYDAIARYNEDPSRARPIRLHVGYGQNLTDGPGMEERARKQRWKFANSVAKSDNSLFMTGHHLDDNIETTLFNLMRGKPHDDLAMQTLNRHDCHYRFKPLLSVPKEIIESQAKKRGLVWASDSSNDDNGPDRNWLRNVIIPQLMERRNLTSSMGNRLNLMLR